MKKVTIADLKSRLSEHLDQVAGGTTVVVYRRNDPIAEIRPLPRRLTTARVMGGTRIELSEAFFDPLPGDIEDAFEGSIRRTRTGSSRVAEHRTRYAAKPPRSK